MSATLETHNRPLLTCLKRKDVSGLGNSRHKWIVPKRIDIKDAVVIRKVHRTSRDTCAYAEPDPLTASPPQRQEEPSPGGDELENVILVERVPRSLSSKRSQIPRCVSMQHFERPPDATLSGFTMPHSRRNCAKPAQKARNSPLVDHWNIRNRCASSRVVCLARPLSSFSPRSG